MVSLSGYNALITGGGSGLGLGCARRFLADGATVTLMGRTEERLRDAAKQLGGANSVRIVVGDVKDEADAERAVAVADEGDGLRIVVASAGVGWAAPIATIPLEAWRNVLDTNMTGTFLTLKHAAPAMRRAGGGSFVAISSVAAVRPTTWLSAYNAAKAGVDHFVRSAAEELGRHNIRVNSVLPGYVPTELNVEVQEGDEMSSAFIANMPLGRIGTPEDVAEAVRFLVGPESSWITGVTLNVDGGHHLRTMTGIYDSFVAEEHGTEWFSSGPDRR